MWGESSQNCENNCQCSGLITDSFKINSGSGTTKRKQEESLTANFKLRMNPHTLDFKSPSSHTPSKRRVLGEIQNSPAFRPKQSPTIERLKSSPILPNIFNQPDRKSSPLSAERKSSPLAGFSSLTSPLTSRFPSLSSPLTSRFTEPSSLTTRTLKRSSTKISRIFEERSRFKMANKENEASMISETFVKLDMEEETRDFTFGEGFRSETVTNWSITKLDFTDALQTKTIETTSSSSTSKIETLNDTFVPEKDTETNLDEDFETLHDLEEEFENDNFDECTKYEIISTDSPNIISRGRTTSRKVTSRNFVFGAPLAETETSTSFNRSTTATRMLTFEDESFEFTSPAAKKPSSSFSVKKSLKFNETPTKNLSRFSETPTKNPLRHERSDSSIGSMTSSPSSSQIRIFTSESTASMESGFISELEEPFLEMEESSNSPKMANFSELLSGKIKDNILTNKDFLKRPSLQRSLSFNPEPRTKSSLFSIDENTDLKKKREVDSENVVSKRRKSNYGSPEIVVEKARRPVLQRAMSENHASVLTALSRSATEPDLIGDFSLPYALPLIGGDHADLKSISCDTLAALIKGEFRDSISDFKVIDCRYPYEFEGGHIKGAANVFTASGVRDLLESPTRPQDGGRSVLVFHCEFSIHRGPKLYRYLRSSDRSQNAENYPQLTYPEIYLLHQGYRNFYQKYPELCTPGGYTAMLDPKHTHLLRKHRSAEEPTSLFTHHKSKSGNRLMY